jgi:Homeobox KN domain
MLFYPPPPLDQHSHDLQPQVMEVSSSPESVQESNLLLAAVEMMKDDVLVDRSSLGKTDVKPATSLVLPKLRSKLGNVSGTKSSTKKSTTLPNETVEYLKAWMMSPEHIAHPYPTEIEKAKIIQDTGLELKQLTNWFVNNRKRYWKPRIEAHMLKDQEVTLRVEATPLSSPVSKRDLSVVSPSSEGSNSGTLTFVKDEDAPSIRSSRRKAVKGNSLITDSVKKLLSAVVSSESVLSSKGAHFISGHNSVASISDGTTSCSDSDEERCVVKSSASPRPLESTIYETIDVHILRPSSSSAALPDESDVSILSNVPPGRILRTYPNYSLMYTSNMDKNSKSNHFLPRRDAEIFRSKKHYLSLGQNGSHITNKTVETNFASSVPKKPNENTKKKRKHEVHVIPSSIDVDNGTAPMISYTMSPRPKYRRHSIDVWKEACQTANHVYDDELPSLEEATRLFGYAS